MKHTLLTLAFVAFMVTTLGHAQDCAVELASVGLLGQEANGNSGGPSLSLDGRFVAFSSGATNLVQGDVNGQPDSFVLDRVTGIVELVSVSSTGMQGNGRSVGPRVSADGRMVAFGSQATNLDPRDTDSVLDVYVHDRVTNTTTLVSERLGTGASAQGCYGLAISADGRFVAFDCIDDNVVPGDSNNKPDVFVRDLVAQTTQLVSFGPQGQQGNRESLRPSISGDGRYVAFISAATNWFPVGPNYSVNYYSGIFIRDRQTSATLPATMLASGVLAPGSCEEPTLSADGRYVAFYTNSRFLVPGQPFGGDVVRWDRLTGEWLNTCVPATGGKPDNPTYDPVLSADGRYVAFETWASNLTVQPSTAPMVLWKDLETGATVAANVDPYGGPANNWADQVAVSGDGRVVAFRSKATNLTPGASGLYYHVYVRACDVASPSVYCKPAKPPGGCVASMTFQGTPSATVSFGFQLRAENLEAKRLGLLFYSTAGLWGQQLPYGYLCMQTPIVRVKVGPTLGTSGCDGSLSMDFNHWIATGGDPTLVAGQSVYAQAWFRNSSGTGQLSDALAFLIGP